MDQTDSWGKYFNTENIHLRDFSIKNKGAYMGGKM